MKPVPVKEEDLRAHDLLPHVTHKKRKGFLWTLIEEWKKLQDGVDQQPVDHSSYLHSREDFQVRFWRRRATRFASMSGKTSENR